MAFIGFAYPSLMLTYIGQVQRVFSRRMYLTSLSGKYQIDLCSTLQAAYLMAYPENIGSTFFASIPFGDGFYWFFFVFAVLAASVASQAIISGAFSIVKQSIALGCFPRVSVINTSKTVGGTIYIPEVGFILHCALCYMTT
jgi:K+ transporter